MSFVIVSLCLSLLTIGVAHAATVSSLVDGFSASGGVTVDAQGNIYVGDFGSGPANGTNIYKITPDGSSVSVFATGIGGATGGRFDSQGNLFWSAYGQSIVYKITSGGQVSPFASVPGPVAIVIDEDDNLFVASCDSDTIRKITPDGTVSTFATSPLFSCANGMTRDDMGNLYVSNFNNGTVTRVDAAGNVSFFATVPGNNAVNLAYVGGTIYVTARAAHQIYAISPAGIVELFAGTGDRGRIDGPAEQAEFSFPNSIGVSPTADKLYVNDVDSESGTSFHPTVLRVIHLQDATPVESTTFGRIKAMFR